MRFLSEILIKTRAKVGGEFVIGIRVSGDELDGFGLDAKEMLKICKTIDDKQLVDYFNVITNFSATPRPTQSQRQSATTTEFAVFLLFSIMS